MYRQVHAYERIAARLASEIAAGRWEAGTRLPGENPLALEFGVSRGTIRQALALLRHRQIVTSAQQGSGTFVTYDRNVLSFEDGLSQALKRHRVPVRITVLRQAAIVDDAALARRLGLPGELFLAFDRRRDRPDGMLVSLEQSRVPYSDATARLLGIDLAKESLVAALAARAGLVATRQDLEVDVAPLPKDVAGAPEAVAMAMLRLTRTLRQHDGGVVEHVTSWLHPGHFRLHVEAPLGEAVRVRAAAGAAL